MKKILAITTALAATYTFTPAKANPLYLMQEEDYDNGWGAEVPLDNESMAEMLEEIVPTPFQIDLIEVPQNEYSMGIISIDSTYVDIPDSVLMLQDKLADYARSYLGTPYVWGSKGPKTFDCSGFMTWIFKKHGLDIGHGSRNQATKGQKINLKDARVGDLMFFTLPREAGSGRVGHVGMVIDVDPDNGNLKFIHASSKGGVKISNFPDNGPYNRRFLQIRRVIDDENTGRVLASKKSLAAK